MLLEWLNVIDGREILTFKTQKLTKKHVVELL